MEIQAWMAWMEMTARTENQDQRALLVPQAPRVLPEKPDLLLSFHQASSIQRDHPRY